MSARTSSQSQVTSAAKAGFSERTGRRLERGERSSRVGQQRSWRTRKDPFEEVWERELVPELEGAPELRAITLLEVLQRRYPGQYPDHQLRTLQRRVKQWKALYGKDKEVMFRQERPGPGQLGLSDFTQLKGVAITVGGEVLRHWLYHFRLAYSGWRAVKVVLGGESYTALTEGLQKALRRLGGAPTEHRTDSLAAAFKNLKATDRDDLTQRYEAFCAHYGMRATRNNRGRGHENGAIESPHGHLKRHLEQALLLRGSADFASVAEYQGWVDEVVEPMNGRRRAKVEEERRCLQPLPNAPAADYTELWVRVTTSSTITVRLMVYSVPSRLIGERLRVHLYDDRLEGYVGESQAVELPRVYAPPGKRRGRRVDYRHVITSLKRKPMAFYHSQLRDDLLPSETYRHIWQVLDQQLPERAACKLMVGVLALAAEQDCEQVLGEFLLEALEQGTIPALVDLQQRFGRAAHIVPEQAVQQHRLHSYDQLLSGLGAEPQEVSHA